MGGPWKVRALRPISTPGCLAGCIVRDCIGSRVQFRCADARYSSLNQCVNHGLRRHEERTWSLIDYLAPEGKTVDFSLNSIGYFQSASRYCRFLIFGCSFSLNLGGLQARPPAQQVPSGSKNYLFLFFSMEKRFTIGFWYCPIQRNTSIVYFRQE
jgi:hypothetical protein